MNFRFTLTLLDQKYGRILWVVLTYLLLQLVLVVPLQALDAS